jgi:hypothetical protein
MDHDMTTLPIKQSGWGPILIIGVAGLLLMAALLLSQLQGASAGTAGEFVNAPARQSTLPPRPTAVPTMTVTPPPVYVPPMVGGSITLRIPSAPAGLWTVVQWQDGLGGWHDVEGWQGTLVDGWQIWWVARRDFGTGPFRWAVYQNPTRNVLLAASESFNLPTSDGDLVGVTVSLKP